MYNYTLSELRILGTKEQSWDGAELKIEEDGLKVWLVPASNRPYDGDYQVETLNDEGRWVTEEYFFNQ